MGRPPLGVRSTHIRLSEGQIERINALVGKQGMSQYIREAVEEKLARDEKQRR
jgi:predicted DNA-binding protein